MYLCCYYMVIFYLVKESGAAFWKRSFPPLFSIGIPRLKLVNSRAELLFCKYFNTRSSTREGLERSLNFLCQDRRRKREGENPHTSMSSASAKHETHSYQPYVQETLFPNNTDFLCVGWAHPQHRHPASSSLKSASSVTPRTSSLWSPWSHHSFPNPLCTTSASGSNPVNTPLG